MRDPHCCRWALTLNNDHTVKMFSNRAVDNDDLVEINIELCTGKCGRRLFIRHIQVFESPTGNITIPSHCYD